MPEYKNPQQEPGMEKRLLLTFAITFILLLAVQPAMMKWLAKKTPPPATQEQQQPAPAAAPAAAAPATKAAPAPSGTRQAATEADIVIENDLYRITFTNKGAQVKSWVLKKYKDDFGRPLELVHTLAAEKYGYPLSLWTYDEKLRNQLSSALYVMTGEMAVGQPRSPKEAQPAKKPISGGAVQLGPDAVADLTYEYADGDLAVRKAFHFDNSYVVKIETAVTQKGEPMQAFAAWPAGFGDQTVAPSYAAARIDTQYGDKVTRLEPKKVSGGATLRGPFNWAGPVDQYFAAVFLPDQPDATNLVELHNEIAIPKDLNKPNPNETVNVPVLGAAMGNANGVTTGRWFVGPKTVDVIDHIRSTPAKGQGAGPNLGGLVDFGFFGAIGKPLFLWLKWTEKYIPNWGWALVVVTIIINVALLPLRLTSMKSALKMQKVQPQIDAIKKRYSGLKMNDPKRTEMNTEIAAIFKEHKVNPAGGCLPLLIQMPFLFAFYTMLSAAIELRQAPWLWIKDLAAPDPYHIMPILIVLSTVLMQLMTPQPGMDPTQRRMMNMMMPVMLGVFSWSVAAGLGLYWLLSTVISIVQQWVMNQTTLGKEMQAEMAKRARKKGQTGR